MMHMYRVRRTVLCGVAAVLAMTGVVAGGSVAVAATPEVSVSVSPSTVEPGGTITVTETISNINGFTILHPRAQLFSAPDQLTGYTSLVSCDPGPGGSCVTTSYNGQNGYAAVLGQALSGYTSATVTFTLAVAANAPGGQETLQGQIFGLNYATPVENGPTLTIDAHADVAVSLTGNPVLGLLVPRLDFTVSIANNGPDPLVGATITTSLPAGLTATSSSCTTGTSVVCDFGALAVGKSASASFSVPIGLLDIGLGLPFTATRTASTPNDPNPANDTASDTCTVVSVLVASCVPNG